MGAFKSRQFYIHVKVLLVYNTIHTQTWPVTQMYSSSHCFLFLEGGSHIAFGGHVPSLLFGLQPILDLSLYFMTDILKELRGLVW